MKRRTFLSQSATAALSSSAVLNTLFHLRSIGSALALEPVTDYKALVCLFLKGGNDANNCIIPRDAASYASYATARGAIAIDSTQLLAVNPTSYAATSGDSRQWGLHPRLDGLRDIFETDRKLAIIGNVGTLVEPVTKAAYVSSAYLPPQLFSHSDQQVQWQSSLPDQSFQTGWGGRLGDMFNSANTDLGALISISMTLAGANSFQVGLATSQYAISTAGSVSLAGYGSAYANALNPDNTYKTTNPGRRLQAFRDVLALGQPNLLAGAYTSVMNRAYDYDRLVSSALGSSDVTTAFPSSNLGQQLKMIARLIKARDTLHHRRQIYYCELDGYDTHDAQVSGHDALLDDLDNSLTAFYTCMKDELLLPNAVTTFTASDFARTFTANKTDSTTAGTDHAWGGHAFVLGGAVNGGEIYGRMPDLTLGGSDDTDTSNARGRWIPTTSVDEYAATLARWFGVSTTDLPTIFPNLGRFTTPNLGFMA